MNPLRGLRKFFQNKFKLRNLFSYKDRSVHIKLGSDCKQTHIKSEFACSLFACDVEIHS